MGLVFAAFFLVMPLLALGSPLGFLPIVVGDNQGALFFLAGALVLLYQHVKGHQWRFGKELRAAAPAIANGRGEATYHPRVGRGRLCRPAC